MAQSTKKSGPGYCETSPEKTSWPTRFAAQKTVEIYEAQGYRVWVQRCPTCGWWHIHIHEDETKH